MSSINIIFTGGLGNQMFEYTLVMSLRHRGYRVKIDISYYDFFKMHNGYELDRVFGIKEKTINRRGLHMIWLRTLHRFRPKKIYCVDNLQFDKDILLNPQLYMFGYWQDERYFSDIETDVRKTFSFKDIDENNRKIADEMQECNSISLHIRRGDYAAFGMTLMKDDYYRKAIEYIRNKVDNPFFYIFSDDAEVAKCIVDKIGINYTLLLHNRGYNSYKDMYLMSKCKHNIIANSSFSWWGAWLNNNKGKIIVAPKEWDVEKKQLKPQCKNWTII